jgi:hypothetical protein
MRQTLSSITRPKISNHLTTDKDQEGSLPCARNDSACPAVAEAETRQITPRLVNARNDKKLPP